MKDSKIFTLVTLVILVVFVVVILFSWGAASNEGTDNNSSDEINSDTVANGDHDISLPSRPDSSKNDANEPSQTESSVADNESTDSEPESSEPDSSEPVSSEPVPSEAESSEPEGETSNVPDDITVSMDDALFIGDSRTVGIKEYSGLNEPDYFCTVGMSIYNYRSESVSVDGVGEVTLSELLSKKQYGKIYIMLGVNEVGNDIPTTASKYESLVNEIKNIQPNALIFIQANLHVSKNRHDQNIYGVTNDRIDTLNGKLAQIADLDRVFYLDANVIFDDDNGNLRSDTTGDGVHLYAKFYPIWTDWIVRQTAIIIDWRG